MALPIVATNQNLTVPHVGLHYGKRGARQGSTTMSSPVRVYLHHDLRSWLGRLFSRPGIKDMVDSRPVDSPSGVVEDIWQSTIFADLKDSSISAILPGPWNGSTTRLQHLRG